METAGQVRVAGVELRVVGGRLEVKREVGKDLELCCDTHRKTCSLSFSQGQLHKSLSTRTQYRLLAPIFR